jgi:hypothetical protein
VADDTLPGSAHATRPPDEPSPAPDDPGAAFAALGLPAPEPGSIPGVTGGPHIPGKSFPDCKCLLCLTEQKAAGTGKPRMGRPRTWNATDEPAIHHPLVTGIFLRGLLAGSDGLPVPGPDGEPIPVIVRRAPGKDGTTNDSVIWVGSWRIIGRHEVYKISPERGLSRPEWSQYATMENSDRSGQRKTFDVSAGDLRQQIARAVWPDASGAGFTGKSSYIRDYMRVLAMGIESTLMIRGQGPFYFDDRSPSCNLSKKLAFAARSVIFDADGEMKGIRIDTAASDAVDYYDLTPAREISDRQIREGCELIKHAYDECPNYPSIPAAFIGQQMTAFIVAVRPEFHSAILFSGIRGSGKTKYASRWDAIQARASRITRGPLQGIQPVINLGDRRGTGKGTGYRITKYGGYAATIDDVLKNGDLETKIREQSQLVRDLVSSYESGGAPLGYIDRAQNDITDRASPALHSSVKIMSELPLIGDSTLERLIVLPHISDKWDSQNVFNRNIADELSSPDGREIQHLAYSAYVQWAFTRIESDLDECLAKAVAETATWEVPARTQEKYAAVLAGHFMFERFCEIHSIDISGEINRAIAALRVNAQIQASTSLPLWQEWAGDLRRAIIQGKISFPGRPELDPDGRPTSSFGPPWIKTEITGDDGITRPNRIMPPGMEYEFLGLTLTSTGSAAVPIRNAIIGGFIIPPRDEKRGGPKGSELSRNWLIACRKERFAELCEIAGKASSSNRAYDPVAVITALRMADPILGDRGVRVYMQNGPGAEQAKTFAFRAYLLIPEGN